jgi:hypothetical protein
MGANVVVLAVEEQKENLPIHLCFGGEGSQDQNDS